MIPFDLNSVDDNDNVGALVPDDQPMPKLYDIVTITDDGDTWQATVIDARPNRWVLLDIGWSTWCEGGASRG